MKNLLYFFLLSFAVTIVYSCVKEDNITSLSEDVQLEGIENRDASVWICHKAEGNNPHAIYVDENAVEAHLGHGDVLLDVDGDGYTATNACGEGSMDDCDDEDATVNPGAEEVPYDGIDNDCDPATLDDDLDEDGYPLATDCDDTDAAVNPGAEEVCGDGIDNNCDGEIDEGCIVCSSCEFGGFLNSIDLTNACLSYNFGSSVVLYTLGLQDNRCCGLQVSPDGSWTSGSDNNGAYGTSSTGCFDCFVEYVSAQGVPTCPNLVTSTNANGTNPFTTGAEE